MEMLTRVSAWAPKDEGDRKVSLHQHPKGTVVAGAGVDIVGWAQAVSLASKKPVVCFVAFDGVWSMDIFNQGEHVLFIDSHHPNLEPLLGGDLNGAANLFAVKIGVFKRFYKLLVEDESGEELAFPKDEIPANDEWGCWQLAEHLGIANYPDDPDVHDREFVVSGVSNESTWAQLPDRLTLSVCAPATVPRKLRFRTEIQQREAIAWAENWTKIAPMLALSVVERIEANGPKHPGVKTLVEAFAVECHHALGNPRNAMEHAEELISAWLGPVTVGAANQFLSLEQIRDIANLVRPGASGRLLALCDEVNTADEPDIALNDGDFF